MQALKCHQKYSMGQMYDYRSQIEHSIINSLSQTIKSQCPIRKIIRIGINLLKLNLFECALLCWLLKKSPNQRMLQELGNCWSIKFTILQQQYDKKVLLLLLLNGYHVKNHLLTTGCQIDIDPYILQNIQNFDQIYRNWKPIKSLKDISLTQINKIFDNWTSFNKNVKKKVDYNRIVDKILQLSKTYNVNGQDDKQIVKSQITSNPGKNRQIQGAVGRKKHKKNPTISQQQPSQKTHVQKNSSKQQLLIQNQSPMKQSKQSLSNRIPWFDQDKLYDENNNELNPLRKSTRMMNQSIYELKDDKQYDLLLNPNDSLFRSFRSNQNGGNLNNNFNFSQQNQNMLGSLNLMRNTMSFNNGGGGTNSVGMNNSLKFGEGFMGNLFGTLNWTTGKDNNGTKGLTQSSKVGQSRKKRQNTQNIQKNQVSDSNILQSKTKKVNTKEKSVKLLSSGMKLKPTQSFEQK